MICSVDGCNKTVIARGWCPRHYDSWRYHGDPLRASRGPRGEAVAWIKAQVNYSGAECLIWPFYRKKTGYAGTVWPDGINGEQVLASRYMCALTHGPAPTEKHEAAHACGKGHLGCIHPKHLRWATRQENVDDKIQHGTNLIGEKSPHSKLRSIDVIAIRSSDATLESLAAKYGVSSQTVWDAKVGRTWRHITVEQMLNMGARK